MPLAYPNGVMGDQWVVAQPPLNGFWYANTPASATWPAANRAIYMPVYLTADGTCTQLWTMNGATALGNLDIGIFDSAGTKLFSSGAVAQSGTNTIQPVDITDQWLPAGAYYIGLSHSTNTGTYFRYATGTVILRTLGLVQQATSHPLPASITPAAVASGYWPICGLTYRTA